MRIDVVSVFPDYLAPLTLSLLGKARESGLVDLRTHDLRHWTHDPHHTVDDTPYGGGAGMVMKPEPWGEALDDIMSSGAGTAPVIVVPTPSGTPFDQVMAEELSGAGWLLFACGRYEGIDQRVLDHYAGRSTLREVSLGDFVLNGGEVAAMAVIEAVVRLLPGFMGNPESLREESHRTGAGGGLLEYPVYTKPASWRGLDVPEVLRSGHHGEIQKWRKEQALRRTAARRPDLASTTEVAGLSGTLEGLELRPAVPADAGPLLVLQRACWVSEAQDNAMLFLPALVETLDDVKSDLSVWTTRMLWAGSRLVGSVRGRLVGSDWEIGRLMVAEDLRGRGLGHLLLEHIESLAPREATAFTLFTGARSAANLRRYRKAGYRPSKIPYTDARGQEDPRVVRLAKPRRGTV
jgi:tRNA (guanine37-N1)-methyltransferase